MTICDSSTPVFSLLDLIAVKRELVIKNLARHIVNPETGCHEWAGPTRANRRKTNYEEEYGVVSFKYQGKSKKVGAHRLAFAFHHNIDPGELFVCHRCDFPLCVNGDHLFLGTHQQNMDDRESKGRNVPRNVLSEDDVRFILTRLDKNTDEELARFVGYKVQTKAIRDIRAGRTWRHLTNSAA